MAFIVGELIAPIGADLTGFNQGLDKMDREGQRALKKFGTNVRQMGTDMRQLGTQMSLLVTLPLIAAAAVFAKAGNDIDKALKDISLRTGVVGQDLEKLGDDFREVFKDVPDSADRVSAAIGDIHTRTGQTGKGLQDLASRMLFMSRVAGTSVSQTVAAVTRLFGDWTVATEDQVEIMDQLFRTAQTTGVNITQLTESVVNFGAPLRILGFNLQEGLSILGKWEKEGVNVMTVLSGMRFALGKFAATGRDAKQAFAETLAAIKELSADRATKLAFTVFGQRAANDMTAAIREGRFEFEELTKSIIEGEESMASAEERTRSLAEKFAILKNRAVLAAEPLGVQIVEAIEKLLPKFQALVTVMEKGVKLFTTMPASLQASALGLAALAAIAGPLLFLIGGMMQGIGALILLWPKLTALVTASAVSIAAWQAAALTAAFIVGFEFGKRLEPYISQLLGLNRLLSAKAPHDDLVKHLTGDRDAFNDAARHLSRLKRELGLTGEEWRFLNDHTKENAKRVVELTEKARELHSVKMQEGAAAREAAEALREEAQALEELKQLTPEQKEFIEDTIEALRERNQQLKLGADAYLIQQLAQSGASAADIEEAKRLQDSNRLMAERDEATKKGTRAAEGREKGIERIVAGLEREYDALFLTNEQQLLAAIYAKATTKEEMAAAEAEAQYALALLRGIEAREKKNKLEQEAAVVKDRIATLTERQATEEARLNEMVDAGVLSMEDFAKAMDEVAARYDALAEKAEKVGPTFSDFAKRAGSDIERAFSDAFMATSDGADQMVEDIKRAIRRLISDWLAHQLMRLIISFGSSLFSFGGGGGGGGADVGEAASSIPAAEGGLLRGKGTGTSDSNLGIIKPSGGLVAFSDGEFVMRRAAVNKWGVGFLQRLNAMGGGAVEAMAMGGLIARRAALAGGGVVATGSGFAGGDAPQFTYNIDARGAAPGTERKIEDVLRRSENRIVKRAVSEVANKRMRGGGFAKVMMGR